MAKKPNAPKSAPKAGAKKPRAAAAAKSTAQKTSPVVTETVKMTPAKKLAALLASGRAAYKEGRAIAGEFGAEVKEAAEHDHLHKKAFAAARSADRMEPEELADFFAHRDYYEESLGLRKRANAVVRMNFNDDGNGPSEASAGSDEDPEARTSSVTPFPTRLAAE